MCVALWAGKPYSVLVMLLTVKVKGERSNLKPQTSKPQTSKPQNLKPQNLKPQNLKPQNLKPQNLKPQTSKPQTFKPQTSKPQTSNLKTSNLKPQNLKTSKDSQFMKIKHHPFFSTCVFSLDFILTDCQLIHNFKEFLY